ncbi:uncharacterized protein LOC106642867 [Copidosoma floridanum]|uniref:uncharacterized protein LOC106642867 n=1 Tax=Copidosoma floridanum TaxID=29053 RepID=UPI0006C99DF5|nr:uncharacterized protein LOC106642867 [Copidosoma floridanum]
MEALWNQVNLQAPPYRPWDVSITEFDPKGFLDTINRVLCDFKTFSALHAEAALLSRLIYRMKSKFRSDKGLKHMEKVNRALLNYLNMSLHKDYEILQKYTEINNGIVSLPSRQTLEYVLVRTQGFAKLMCRVESMAVTAASILQSRLYIGQSWTVAMIAFAVISRIWILSRHMVRKSCTWYDDIYKFAKSFKIVGISWLPDKHVLPKKLSKWLNIPWLSENFDTMPLHEENWSDSIFNLIQVNTETEPTEVNSINSAIDKAMKDELKESVMLKSSLTSAEKTKIKDLGQSISRKSFEKIQQKSTVNGRRGEKKKTKTDNNTKNEKKPALLDLKSEKDLVSLLTADSFPGLDKLKWNILKKQTKKLILKLTNNNTQEVDKKLCKKVARRIENWISSH